MILQFAKLPPPIGGVSIHVKRLLQSLKEVAIPCDILDYSKEKNLIHIYKKIKNATIIHIHLSRKIHRLFFVIFFKLLNKKVVVTFHGKYDFTKLLDIYSLKLCHSAIILNNFSFLNAKKHKNGNVFSVGAFIPPNEMTLKSLDIETLASIFSLRKNHKYLFCTNASSYVLDEHNFEVYMGSLLIDFFSKNNDYGLIFSDPSGTYYDFFKKNNIFIPKNVFIINKSHDFINVIRKSDAFIRATTIDGDSLSVKEALYCGIRVFATDIIDRPKDVILIKNIQDIVESLESISEKKNTNVQNNFWDIKKIYELIQVN